ncbi:caspase family protein [Pseudogemmobacter bohemicus]|uniref:caspase family protein n=1 Tax=Pseudogemmobacter bohemicus TaxID=2250708 RepID=UPI000DD43E23|nr:caspase family protein [Pseudogemmobacter bohemicus]
MLRRFVFVLLMFFGLAAPALAERRVALVLAAQEYRHLRPLANPVNDARAIEDLLKSLGFEVWTETDRDLRRMRRALEDFRVDGEGADLALVFYAGHGVAIDGVNYLLPVDAEARSAEGLAATSLPFSEVQETLAAISPNAIFLLDACRNDPFAGLGASDPDGRGAVALAEDGADAPKTVGALGRIGRAEGALIAFAAAPGATAADGNGKNSPFTEALLRNFGREGTELRLSLTIVQQDVYDRTRGRQMPYIESGLPRLIYLSGEGELPERELLLVAMERYSPELRGEVETVAEQNDMPLAPLYRAVLTGDLEKLSVDDRRVKLEEAARAYATFESDLLKLASDDPRVTDLRAKAEEQFALGASDAGRALMAEATEIDAKSESSLRDNMVARTLSQAATHVLNANAARASLRYDLAISDLTQATELYNRVRADLPDREAKEAYALALSDLAWLYLVAGNSSSALSVTLTQVDYLDSLTRAEPEDIGWRRQLMWALKGAGEIKVQKGFLADADADYARADELTAALIAAWPEDSDLLREREVILNSRGSIRLTLADYQGALAAHNEALEIGLALYDQAPDSVTHARDISFTHEKLGDVWSAMGDFERAREAYDVSLEISQDIANRYPAVPTYQLDLAVGYERLGEMLMSELQYDSALAVLMESQKIRDEQQSRDPGNVVLKRDSAVTVSRMGDVYLAMGDSGSALMNWQHALGLRRELVDLDPQNAIWLRDLSVSYERIGDLYLSEGVADEALAAANEALALRQAVVDIDPQNLPPQRDLTISLEKLARIYDQLGDVTTARELFGRSLEIRRWLVGTAPGVQLYRLDVAYTLVSLGDAMARGGEPAAALPLLEEGREIRVAVLAALPKDAPVDPTQLRELSIGLNIQVAVLLKLQDSPRAIELARQSVETMDRVAGLRPADPNLLIDRMFAANRLGEALEASGDLAGALVAYRETSGYAFAASSADPWNVIAARDYALSLENAGRVLMAQEDFATAKQDYEAAVALRKWITGQQPASVSDQRNLAYALRFLSDACFFLQDFENGRTHEEQALAIMRWIAGVEPENPYNVTDLALSLYRASHYYRDGSLFLTESVALLKGLEAEGRMPEGPFHGWIAIYEERLKGVRTGGGKAP